MNPAAKLAVFVVVLGAALGGGAAIGKAVGPIDDTDDEQSGHEQHGSSTDPAEMDSADDEEQRMPGGVLISAQGYTLETDDTILDAGSDKPFTFRITGPNGTVVRDFVSRHERELHLILVGSDLAAYHHLHPVRAVDGVWAADLPALAPGVYRAFADFAVADGPELTLGLDVSVPGNAVFAPLPAAAATAAVDGYEVTMTGAPVAGSATEVGVTVTKDGEPVTDLEPYLGAFGHLVAIRGGDLAYLHVHPLSNGEPHDQPADRGGPTVRFAVGVPSLGDYRLFFDFSHGGSVRTAAFTVHVEAGDTEP